MHGYCSLFIKKRRQKINKRKSVRKFDSNQTTDGNRNRNVLSFLNSNSRLFLGVFFAREPIAPRTSVFHYESTRMAHTHAHKHTTPVPAEDLPEIRNVSSGDTWGAAPGSSDRRYDKSTVSLLLSSGIRTAHFSEQLFPGEREAS